VCIIVVAVGEGHCDVDWRLIDLAMLYGLSIIHTYPSRSRLVKVLYLSNNNNTLIRLVLSAIDCIFCLLMAGMAGLELA